MHTAMLASRARESAYRLAELHRHAVTPTRRETMPMVQKEMLARCSIAQREPLAARRWAAALRQE